MQYYVLILFGHLLLLSSVVFYLTFVLRFFFFCDSFNHVDLMFVFATPYAYCVRVLHYLIPTDFVCTLTIYSIVRTVAIYKSC